MSNETRAAGHPQASVGRFGLVLREELGPIHPRWLLARALMAPLPIYAGGRIRVALMRAVGFSIGQGTIIFGPPQIAGAGDIYRRLSIGAMSAINIGCHFDLNDTISIGDHVGIGHEVMILTASHKLGPSTRRNGPLTTAPVRIESGAWIGARATILPGVTVGAGAVVSAGAVVNKNVAPNSLVAGAPAQVVVPRLPGA